jgi:hypothetical protein
MKTPPLPGLFEITVDPMSPAVILARDEAMARVASHAEERAPDFTERAQGFVLRYLQEHGPTSGEVLSLACKAAGIRPHDDRAFGPVYFTLSRRRLIEQVGTTLRARGHGTAGGRVWQLTSTTLSKVER